MPRFAANLSMMYPEHAFLDRFAAAAADGFTAVEYLFPYEWPAARLAAALADHALQQVLFNAAQGDFAAGERGIAALPGREDEFRTAIERGLEYAAALACPRVHVMAGLAPDAESRAAMGATYVANLAWAAQRAAAAGVDVLIEPINTRDIPGFFLTHSRQALDLIDRVGSDNLYLQYDIYHMQVMEGDLARTIERNLDRIAHIQVADNPGRYEPGTGEINYPFLYQHLDRIGYAGWVGAEYRPRAGTVEGLGWFQQFARRGTAAA
jgi:hydroxypyruvate isomerase